MYFLILLSLHSCWCKKQRQVKLPSKGKKVLFSYYYLLYSLFFLLYSFIPHHHFAEPVLEYSSICHRRILMDDREDIPMAITPLEVA